MTEVAWQSHAHKLADHLTALGALDAGWRPAFQAVPRHVFVPRFYRSDDTIIDGTRPKLRKEWLAAVYSDESLITQQIKIPGTDMLWPTSSSTQPSLMARMLGLLDVAAGHTVMEIGTGTGYNAALLSHRLGDRNIASIDIDPTLIEEAIQQLDQAGYHPALTVGDGAAGIPTRAPYDRIVATCAVPSIPMPWINQLQSRGVIVADIRGELSTALVKLTKTELDTVQGRFLAVPGHFMWLRTDPSNPLRDGGTLNTVINGDGARTTTTTLGPAVLNDPEFLFMVTLAVPGIASGGHVSRDRSRVHILRTTDGSWAEIGANRSAGRHPVSQGGSRSIWDEIEVTAKRWADLGSPDRSRFGLTATAGAHHFWIDNPDNTLD